MLGSSHLSCDLGAIFEAWKCNYYLTIFSLAVYAFVMQPDAAGRAHIVDIILNNAGLIKI
jgi:hypothetical protein